MFAEVKKVTNFLKSDKGIKELRNKILLILLIFTVLLIANRLFFTKIADRGEFYLSLTRTKIAFAGNVSVYSVDINPNPTELAKFSIDTLDTDANFYLPLFSLLFYYPFTLIKNFDWSLALWLTTNQILIYFIINTFLKVSNWKINIRYRHIIALATLVVYFIYYNVFTTNLSILQLFLIVTALDKTRKKQYIFAGILIGLSVFNPYQFFIPLIVIFILNMRNKRTTINFWTIITIILVSLLMIVFDMNWVLEMIKVLLLEPTTYPFIVYGEYLSSAFPGVNTIFFEAIPIIVYAWFVIEWLRLPKENYMQELWLICMGFTLNTILHMWISPYSTSAYLVVMIFTAALWFDRSNQKFKYISLAIYAAIFIILPIIKMVLNRGLLSNSDVYIFNIIVILLLIMNLYWVRLWIANPYYAINSIEED